MEIARRKLLVTGAAGGMGRACARLLGATHDLVLTDAIAPALAKFAAELRAESYTVLTARPGDLEDDVLIGQLVADVQGDLPAVLLHTAGLSPALAGARAIMAVNLVATVKLLDAIEPVLRPGSCAVLIASTAGHMMPPIPHTLPLLADPLAAGFLDAICAMIDGMVEGAPAGAPGLSYVLSKQAVLALVEQRAIAWGRRGARIVSISPGMILTPMGRTEMAETQGAQQLADITPAGRCGTAMDIALAAQFLASDNASFISGCDIKVDGGGTAATRMLAAQAGATSADHATS